MADVWVVPGAPLEAGKGWRIWYSWPGERDYTPAPVRVVLNGVDQNTVDLPSAPTLENVPGVNRRMRVRSVGLADPKPGSVYEVHVPEAGAAGPFRWRSLPAEIDDRGVAFLLASCFYRDNDKPGAYRAAVLHLAKRYQPAFKFLVGDQIYADWPWDLPIRFGATGAVKAYAERYEQYWGDPWYRDVLQATPNVVTCDDHEFWNNYPEWQLHMMRAVNAGQRTRYRHASQQLYHLYQASLNHDLHDHSLIPTEKRWHRFRVGRVSFFVVDSRSERTAIRDDKPGFLLKEQWDALRLWADELTGPGVLVLGQPIYLDKGDLKDYSLKDFPDDYARLWDVIRSSLSGENNERKPHQILILSGDIHTGRVSVGRPFGMAPGSTVTELIASPASMVQPGSTETSLPPSLIYTGLVSTAGKIEIKSLEDSQGEPVATLDANLAMIQMFPGTNGRIRFSYSILSIRPFDDRSGLGRLFDPPPPAILRTRHRGEIELW